MRIDLHAHSTASDGTDTPGELVAAAAAAGLDVVAITDHDSTAGWAEATEALPAGLRLIRGAEFSCLAPTSPTPDGINPDGTGNRISVHILGYLFDPQAEPIVAEQARLRTQRRLRLRGMAERLAADGIAIDPVALLDALPVNTQPGRPHLANALVRVGAAGTVGEAFQRYLVPGSPYYVERDDTDVGAAIRMIRAAGGVPVLAHAFAHRRGPVLPPAVIAELGAAGLAGLEVDHPDHAQSDRVVLRRLAAELDLIITGSSDYHGVNKAVHLGQETTAPRMLERIEELASASRVTVIGG